MQRWVLCRYWPVVGIAGTRHLKVIYATRSAGHYPYVKPLADPLAERGHEVHVLFHPDMIKGYKSPESMRRLVTHERQTPGLIELRPAVSRYRMNSLRNIRTYASYMTRQGQSPYYTRRWKQYIPQPWRAMVDLPPMRTYLQRQSTQQRLAEREANTPPCPAVVEQIKQIGPDLIIASPLNYWYSEEIEYVKAAAELGIRSAMLVFSWDNLTTKSLIYHCPDVVLVWNDEQVEEAESIHGISADKCIRIGAPVFDEMFALRDTGRDKATFCADVGLDADRPILLYMGSSVFIAQDETWMVRKVLEALQQHADPAVRDCQLMVRPHPAHAEIYKPMIEQGVVVYPSTGSKLNKQGFNAVFRDTLMHCDATFGINTSGMFQAAIIDRPIISVIADRYAETQAQAMHFQQLKRAGVIDLCESELAIGDTMSRLLAGEDRCADARRHFVKHWLRPCGLDRPAGDVAAEALEQYVSGRSTGEIQAQLLAGADDLAEVSSGLRDDDSRD